MTRKINIIKEIEQLCVPEEFDIGKFFDGGYDLYYGSGEKVDLDEICLTGDSEYPMKIGKSKYSGKGLIIKLDCHNVIPTFEQNIHMVKFDKIFSINIDDLEKELIEFSVEKFLTGKYDICWRDGKLLQHADVVLRFCVEPFKPIKVNLGKHCTFHYLNSKYGNEESEFDLFLVNKVD